MLKASRRDQARPVEKWVKGLTCPRCGARAEPNGKAFAFGVFEGWGYSCSECERMFNAYYRDEVFNHTVPKADVEIYELETEREPPAPEELSPPPEDLVEDAPVLEEVEAEQPPPALPEEPEVDEAQVIEDEMIEEISPALPDEEDMSVEIGEGVPPQEPIEGSSGAILESLRKLRDDTIQVNELRSEEDRVVEALLKAFLDVMASVPGGFPVNPEILPGETHDVDRLSVSSSGELLILYLNGEMDAFELSDPDNRDLLVDVINDVFPRVRSQIVEMRGRLEKRIVYLSTVTEELRGMAASISEIKGRI